MPDWQERLAAIRRQAALNCGLTEYPAELVHAWEAIDLPQIAWGNVAAEHKAERIASFQAAKGRMKDAGRTACAAPHKV